MAANEGKIPGAVIAGVATANGYLGAALTAIATYKAARAAWKAAHPSDDPTAAGWKSDQDLIDVLGADADGLVAHADAILAKYSA